MRWYLSICAALVAVVGSATPAPADVKMDEPTKKACTRALEWLASQQNQDGSWSDGGYAHNTAITAFALLGFMSQGHLPNQGQFGPEVAKGARFLISCSREDGYLVGGRGGNMYCHAMATLALAELWGSTNNEDIKKPLKKAVDLIIKSQAPEGGWRYQPYPNGSDISITVMQVMALRAANNAGLKVPVETMNKALAYIDRCYNRGGGFSYQAGGGAPGFARTAAGLCILFLTEGDRKREGANARVDQNKRFTKEEMPKAIAYLKGNFLTYQHFFYGHYYAAHAMHRVGGKEWDEWYVRIKNNLLPQQDPRNGSWTRVQRGEVGPVYQTSIAVIILSVPANYLPIFQR